MSRPQGLTAWVIVWKGLGGPSAAPGIFVWCPACGDDGAPPTWVPDSEHGHVLLVEVQLEHLAHRPRPECAFKDFPQRAVMGLG